MKGGITGDEYYYMYELFACPLVQLCTLSDETGHVGVVKL